MKIGLLMPFTEDTANPAEFCRAAEAWVSNRCGCRTSDSPSQPQDSFPAGGPIPPVYAHMGDQFVRAQHGCRRRQN